MEIMFERPGGGVALISIDATIEEGHNSSALITEHNVEEGSNITDHIRPENDVLTIVFMISNTPITVPGSHMDGVTGDIQPLNLFVETAPRRADGNPIQTFPATPGTFFGFGIKTLPATPDFKPQPLEAGGVGGQDGATVLQFSAEFDRVRAVYDELRGIIGSGTRVIIITSLRTYENMGFANLSAPRSAASGNAITFSVDAKQLRIVSTETVAAPEPVETRGESRNSQGGQQTEDSSEAESPRASLWHNLFF